MEWVQSRQTLISEMRDQEKIILEKIAPRLLWTPVPLKASTFFVDRFSNSEAKPSTCKLTIYGTQHSVGPYDESSVVSFLFPQHSENSANITSYYDHDEWSRVSFAEMTEFIRPSMAIFTNDIPLEIFWIGRVYYHNPQHPYDYQVHVALLN